MFRNKLCFVLNSMIKARVAFPKCRPIVPVSLGLATAFCNIDNQVDEGTTNLADYTNLMKKLDHEFLVRQSTTVNVNAASQLINVILFAIEETSERIRKVIDQEIKLLELATQWGDITPPEHWDKLVETRGICGDLNYAINKLYNQLEYAESIGKTVAELAFVTGNAAGSDAICERLNQVTRCCDIQKKSIQNLQKELLSVQQLAITKKPDLEETVTDVQEQTKN